MRKLFLGLTLLLASATGCASAAQPLPTTPDAPSAVAAEPVGATGASPPPAPAWTGRASVGSGGSLEPSAAAAPVLKDRPGLGTEYGETRTSFAHDVDFARADPARPFAVATLHYNDQRGAEALASYHGWHGPALPAEPVVGGAILVSVRDAENRPLEAIHLADRTLVIGEPGERYTIVVENQSGHRVEAVATVDGLDVMNGRSGSVTNRGYVLDAHETLTIDGFRQSAANVAAFRFAAVKDSYAARTGDARNVGVIGVAFFDERGDAYARWSPEELRRRDTADPFPAQDHRYAPPPPARW